MKLVVEADDHDTRRALARLELGPPFEIIAAPLNGPRTKPKALNVALPFARGSFTVVYDAEDVPEPDQLRRAVDTFMVADEGLACVQAALTVETPRTAGWRACSRPLTPASSMLSCPAWRRCTCHSAWRLVEPFSYGRVVPSRRLGPL